MTIIAVKGSPYISLVAQSYQAIILRSTATAADAAYAILKTVPLKAGTMGLNSRLLIETDWDMLTTGTKSFGIDFGGTNMGGATNISGTVIGLDCRTAIKNLNSLTSQSALNSASYGTQTIVRATASIDTSAAVSIDFKAKWSAQQADALQTITLVGYSIWHYPAE